MRGGELFSLSRGLLVEPDGPDYGPGPADDEEGGEELADADGDGGTHALGAETGGDESADAGEEYVDY